MIARMPKAGLLIIETILAIMILGCPEADVRERASDLSKLGVYENEEKGLSFKYPLSWTLMTPGEVVEKSRGVMAPATGAVIFVVNERDPDKNVNIIIVPAQKDYLTADELEQLEVMLDGEYPKIFTGFKKISAKLLTVAGVQSLEYVAEVDRVGKLLRVKGVMLVKEGRQVILTFTAPSESFSESDEACFETILDTAEIR